jgi:hypothetical protein
MGLFSPPKEDEMHEVVNIMMKTVFPNLSWCTSWSNGSNKSANYVSDTRNLKIGERQSCEQLVSVDEPHAE